MNTSANFNSSNYHFHSSEEINDSQGIRINYILRFCVGEVNGMEEYPSTRNPFELDEIKKEINSIGKEATNERNSLEEYRRGPIYGM